MNIKTILKSSVAASALFAFAAPVSTTTAMAADEFGSAQPTKLVMSGRITRALWHADDGTSDKTFFTQGDSESQIRWIASGTLSDSVTAGATMEMSMPRSNEQGGSTLHGGTDETIGGSQGTDAAWGIRHEYLWVDHKQMGKLSFGQTSVATDGVGNITATGVTYGRSGRTFGPKLTFINTTAAANAVSTNTVDAVFGDLNTSRTDVIKYNAPTFGGVGLSISRDDTSNVQTAIRYSGKFGAVAVGVGAGYLTGSGATNFTALAGITATHDNGMNFSYQTGKRSIGQDFGNQPVDTNNLGGRDDPYFHGFQIGYKAAKMVSVGGTNFAVTMQSSQNMKENDGDASSWGVHMLQNFDALGATISLGYSRYSYDAEGEVTVGTKVNEDYDDIDVISLMTVFNF